MKLSVALCTYNGENYLPRQLDSILSQSCPVDEIVICDDGSVDNTVAILTEYASKYDSKVRVHLNSSTLKAINNFKQAIGLCSGDYIFLSDQDDTWHIDKVKTMVDTFEKTRAEMVFTDARLIDSSNQPLNVSLWQSVGFSQARQDQWLKDGGLVDLLYRKSVVTGATAAMTKHLAQQAFAMPIPAGVWHDEWLAIHAAANNALVWIPTQLTNYRIHENQQLGIGNGIEALKGAGKTISLKEILFNISSYYTTVKTLTEKMAAQYNFPQKDSIITDSNKWINWCFVRTNLPANTLQRFFYVLRNFTAYTVKRNFPRDMLRDIVKPH